MSDVQDIEDMTLASAMADVPQIYDVSLDEIRPVTQREVDTIWSYVTCAKLVQIIMSLHSPERAKEIEVGLRKLRDSLR